MTHDVAQGKRRNPATAADYGPRARASRFKGVVAVAALSGILALGGAGLAAASDVRQQQGLEMLGLSIFATSTISESLYAAVTLEEMTATADLLALGEVIASSAPYLHADMRGASPLYYRDVFVRVESIVKGSPVPPDFLAGVRQESAFGPSVEQALSETGAVVVIRTPVDSYGGIGVSTGMGEISAGTRALFALTLEDPTASTGRYRLFSGEFGIYRADPDGGYQHFDGKGPRAFTLDELKTIVR